MGRPHAMSTTGWLGTDIGIGIGMGMGYSGEKGLIDSTFSILFGLSYGLLADCKEELDTQKLS